jgi:hypothetical protein
MDMGSVNGRRTRPTRDGGRITMKYVFTVTRVYEVEATSEEKAIDVMGNEYEAEQYLVDQTLEFKGVE